ncbi:hypothetical protein H6G41_32470 [Tolypothrix sp. FACHB-123]|uniref:hypothetical protein n=1 Tax=Tolypothrix sp. FACHB-123 TaxID=2692868 RepID=UPI001685D971|nr:hypothetical protein [Tolypothrix sp. FACHB-123]MBD2359247.1 hypothetical protein [Tolypothrix sp. FACHB-123]
MFLAFLMRERKPVSYRIDSAILEVLGKLAKEQNTSVNRYIETHFLKVAIERGFLPEDTELLGETRGGKRKSNTVSD